MRRHAKRSLRNAHLGSRRCIHTCTPASGIERYTHTHTHTRKHTHRGTHTGTHTHTRDSQGNCYSALFHSGKLQGQAHLSTLLMTKETHKQKRKALHKVQVHFSV